MGRSEGVAPEVVGWGGVEVREETAGPARPQESDGSIRALRETLRGLRGVVCGVESSEEVSRDSEGTSGGSGAREEKGRGRSELTRERQVYLA